MAVKLNEPFGAIVAARATVPTSGSFALPWTERPAWESVTASLVSPKPSTLMLANGTESVK